MRKLASRKARLGSYFRRTGRAVAAASAEGAATESEGKRRGVRGEGR